MDMETGIDLHAFFPGDITVNAGDSIFFEFTPMGVPGFHTVTFAPGGRRRRSSCRTSSTGRRWPPPRGRRGS